MVYNATTFEEYPKQVETEPCVHRIIEIRDADRVKLTTMSGAVADLGKANGTSKTNPLIAEFWKSPDGTVWVVSMSNAGAFVIGVAP